MCICVYTHYVCIYNYIPIYVCIYIHTIYIHIHIDIDASRRQVLPLTLTCLRLKAAASASTLIPQSLAVSGASSRAIKIIYVVYGHHVYLCKRRFMSLAVSGASARLLGPLAARRSAQLGGEKQSGCPHIEL